MWIFLLVTTVVFVCCHDLKCHIFQRWFHWTPARTNSRAFTYMHAHTCTDLPLQQQLQHVIRWRGTCPCSKVPDTCMQEHVNDFCIMTNKTYSRAKYTMHSPNHPLRLQPPHYTHARRHYLPPMRLQMHPWIRLQGSFRMTSGHEAKWIKMLRSSKTISTK